MLTTLDILDTLVPMLATSSRPEVLPTLVGSHVFDQKLDGVRAIAAWTEGDFGIRNRNGRNLTEAYPDLALASTVIDGPLILDGEIVAESGLFEDIAWRDKQKGRADAVQKVPARFVAFDVLYHPTEGDTRHLPYARRRQLLDLLNLVGKFDVSLCSPDPAFFDRLKALGGEGVIAKRLMAPYAKGRSNDWLKVKAIYSVTAVVSGYEPGSGARQDLGAIHLSLLVEMPNGGRMLKPIGKAGSGFSVTTAREMRDAIEHFMETGDIEDFPIVEVECLGLTRSGVLRQPVYKGMRTDKGALDCTYDQLADLPNS